ncbi:MAG: hypothetical protein AAF958_03295 [Planctomycetota bacterium]
MSLPDRLERIVRPIAIQNLTLILVLGQAAMFVLALADPGIPVKSSLMWDKVFEGEVWRLVSFIFVPPAFGLFSIFYFFVFHLVGTALENEWGDARYCAYVYIGIIAAALFGLIDPSFPINALFVETSVFLAFATLAPNFEFLLIVIPVKVKYLAYLTAAIYAFSFLTGDWFAKLWVVVNVLNYFVFFGRHWISEVKRRRRFQKFQAKTRKAEADAATTPRHVCAVCGISNLNDPTMDFRYCSKCTGAKAYCEKHLRNHDCR